MPDMISNQTSTTIIVSCMPSCTVRSLRNMNISTTRFAPTLLRASLSEASPRRRPD